MSFIHSGAPPARSSVIIRIIASSPVHYALDGVNLLEFTPSEFYEVPQRVAAGMIERNWARIITDADLAEAEKKPEPDTVLDMTKIKKEA